MFKPPDWEWSGFGEIGWWVRDGSPGATSCWAPTGSGSTSGGRRDASRRSNPGRTASSTASSCRRAPSTSSTSWCPNRRAMLRQWVRRGKGRNEGKRSQHLAAIGVPTITPVALGEQRKRKFLFENYLVTPAISDAIPLDEFVEQQLPSWPEPRRSRVRQKLAERPGRHDGPAPRRRASSTGLSSRQHPGPVPDPGRARAGHDRSRRPAAPPQVDWKVARQNLALLDHYFWLRSSRTDRYRFLKNYLEHRDGPVAGSAAVARQIEDATRAWAERLWRRWGRRCRSSNKYFEAVPGDDRLGRGLARPGPRRRSAAAGRSRRAVPRPGRDRAEGLADDDGRRDDDDRARAADGGHLQAVQPQEVARPAPEPVPAVARLAVVAGRPGPRQPGHPHPAEPGFVGASAVRPAARSSGSCRTRPTWSPSRRSRPSTWRPTSTRSCRRCRPTSAGRGSAG